MSFPITMRNSAIIEGTKYESRSGVPPPSGMVTQRWRSCDMSTIRIPLNSRKYPGLYALIDEADFELVNQYRWHPLVRQTRTYVRSSDGVFMHRLLMNPAPGMVVDHVNHDALDNRRSNLRVCTTQQNNFNTRPHQSSSSKYKNVSKRGSKWAVSVNGPEGKTVHLGTYASEELAARVADRHHRLIHGEFAVLNFEDIAPDDLLEMWMAMDAEIAEEIRRGKISNFHARKRGAA